MRTCAPICHLWFRSVCGIKRVSILFDLAKQILLKSQNMPVNGSVSSDLHWHNVKFGYSLKIAGKWAESRN